jgi:leucine-rich repeat protein SHOC2
MSGLETLDVADNKVSSVPAEIGELSSLTNLFLQGNSITELPESLSKLALIKRITLTGM